MIRIRTGSRLHFGLLAPFQPGGERAGGCGLMVQDPGIELTAKPASEWRIEGKHAERVSRLVAELQAPDRLGLVRPLHLVVHCAPREHIGLGTGTQLSLAVAEAMCAGADESWNPEAGQRLTGRGRRSRIGVNGYFHGGFLVDSGRPQRCAFPAEWALLMLTPETAQGVHGLAERSAFQSGLPASPALTMALNRRLHEDMLPALLAKDFERFALALADYNRQAGEFYQAVQGGCYSSPWITKMVERLRQKGVLGVGQSSWGPTVFALLPDSLAAATLREQLATETDFKQVELWVTSARNEGAILIRAADD